MLNIFLENIKKYVDRYILVTYRYLIVRNLSGKSGSGKHFEFSYYYKINSLNIVNAIEKPKIQMSES